MKTIPIALASHYALSCTTVCTCLKVTRADGVVVGFTSADEQIVVSSVSYAPGFDVSSLQSTDTLGVDNMELTFLALDELLPEADLLAGLWDNAVFEIFECNRASPADGVNVLKRGTTGEVQLRRSKYTVEFRSLAQALQQTQGITTSKGCRSRLGDAKCTVDLTGFTFTGTLTAVTSARQLADTSRAEDVDYFGEGLLTLNTGAAAGFTRKIKAFASGAFSLSLPLPFVPAVGDSYTAVAGCRKREEDCRDKFLNILNHQGEPHLPGLDALTRSASAEDQPATEPTLP